MTRTKGARRLALLLAVAIVTAGCINPFAGVLGGGTSSASGKGVTVRVVENALAARTILPEFRSEITTVTAQLTAIDTPDNPPVSASATFEDPLLLEMPDVAPGSYTLRVDAYNSSSQKIGSSGEVGVYVGDDPVTAIVTLAPLREDFGTISLSVAFPPGVINGESLALDPDPDVAGDEIYPVSGTDYFVDYGTGEFVYVATIPSGFYFLGLQFFQGGDALAPIIQAVNIYDNLVSAKTIDIDADGLTQAPPSPSGLSVDYPADGAVDLYWTVNSNTEAEYVIYRGGSEYDTVVADTTFWSDPVPPAPGVVTNYEVRGHNAFGESTAGVAVIDASSFDFPLDVNPVAASSFDRPSSILVDWGAADGLVEFDLYLSQDFGLVDALDPGARVLDGVAGSIKTYAYNAPGVGVHYWRVAGRNSLGQEHVSPIWDFDVLPLLWYVAHAANGGDDVANDGRTESTPFATLQKAVDSAFPDENIRLAGDGAESYGGDVVTISKNLSISGGWNLAFDTQDPVTTPSNLRSTTDETTIVVSGGVVTFDGVTIHTGTPLVADSIGMSVEGAAANVTVSNSTLVGGFGAPTGTSQMIRLVGDGSVAVVGGSVMAVNNDAGTGDAVGIAVDGGSSGTVLFESSRFDPGAAEPLNATAFRVESGGGAASVTVRNNTAPPINLGGAASLLVGLDAAQAGALITMDNNVFQLGALSAAGTATAVNVSAAQSVAITGSAITVGNAVAAGVNSAHGVSIAGSDVVDIASNTITLGTVNGDATGLSVDVGTGSATVQNNAVDAGQSTDATGSAIAYDVVSGNVALSTNDVIDVQAPSGSALGYRVSAAGTVMTGDQITAMSGQDVIGVEILAADATVAGLQINAATGQSTTGVSIDALNATVSGAQITNLVATTSPIYAIRVVGAGDNVAILQSEITMVDSDTAETGISVETGAQAGARIERNRIAFGNMAVAGENIGVYTDATRSWIVNNVIAKSGTVVPGSTFTGVAAEGSTGGPEVKQFYIYHNTIVADDITVADSWTGIRLLNKAEPDIRNNLIAGSDDSANGYAIRGDSFGSNYEPTVIRGNAFSNADPVLLDTDFNFGPMDNYNNVEENFNASGQNGLWTLNIDFPYPDDAVVDSASWYETTAGAPVEIRESAAEDLTVEPPDYVGLLTDPPVPYVPVDVDVNGNPRTPGNGVSIGAWEVP